MSAVLAFRIDSSRLRAAIAKVPVVAQQEVGRALYDIGAKFKQVVSEERLSGRPGLNANTGKLRDSLDFRVVPVASGRGVLVGFYGPQGVWAGVHEGGATIKANGNASKCGSGKMLAIPLDAVKTKNKHLRQASPCDLGKWSKTNPKGLKLIKSRRGNLLLVALKKIRATKPRRRRGGALPAKVATVGKRPRVGRGTAKTKRQPVYAITPMYVLKREVKIPKRLGFREAWVKFQPRAKVRVGQAFEAIARAAGARRRG